MSTTKVINAFETFHQKLKDGLDNGVITKGDYLVAYSKWIAEYFDVISTEASSTTESPNPATESFRSFLLQYKVVVLLYDARKQMTQDLATAMVKLLGKAFDCYGDLTKIPSINHVRILADLGDFHGTIQDMVLSSFEGTKFEGAQWHNSKSGLTETLCITDELDHWDKELEKIKWQIDSVTFTAKPPTPFSGQTFPKDLHIDTTITQEDFDIFDSNQGMTQRRRSDSESCFHTASSDDAEDFFSVCESLPPSAPRTDSASPLLQPVEPIPIPRRLHSSEPLKVEIIEFPFEESVKGVQGDVADVADVVADVVAAIHELNVRKGGVRTPDS